MALIKVKTGGVDDTTNLGRRNLTMNGAMQVAQRGTSFAAASSGDYKLDRWRDYIGEGTWTVSQDSDSPDGFDKSLKYLVTSAVGSPNSAVHVTTGIEGLDVQHLQWGTANAKNVTISFWVKGSVTGRYNIEFDMSDTNSATFSQIVSYNINTANTWEYKTVKIIGNTSSALIGTNARGIGLNWWISAAGQFVTGTTDPADGTWSSSGGHDNSVRGYGMGAMVGTTNATWQITGVQMEVGDTATPFEHRPYAEELQLCKRYYQLVESASGMSANTTVAQFNVPFSVEMRSAPTVSISDVNGVTCARITDHAYTDYTVTSGATIVISNVSKYGSRTQIGGFTGLTQGRFVGFLPGGSYSSFMRFDAEL